MSNYGIHLERFTMKDLTSDINSKSCNYVEKIEIAKDTFKVPKDTFERMTETLEVDCGGYSKYPISTGMPKSIFGDSFGYEMQKNIAQYMKEFYSGNVNNQDMGKYFEECCTYMRIYRTQQGQTSGKIEKDNAQIISETYEIFAKENQRAARQANDMEGETINKNYGNDCRKDDWVYYNSDYYYQCEDVKSTLRGFVSDLSKKWEVNPINVEDIEKNSKYTLDGGFDFNSGWNFIYRNQVGRSSLADESIKPPKNFKLFYKESTQPNAKDMDTAMRGILEVWIGGDKYIKDIPFYNSRTGLEGQIFNANELMQNSYTQNKSYHEYADFLKQISVFTRWYSWESGINNKFGNYIPE